MSVDYEIKQNCDLKSILWLTIGDEAYRKVPFSGDPQMDTFIALSIISQVTGNEVQQMISDQDAAKQTIEFAKAGFGLR